MHEILGDRQVCVAAEMTKMYERFYRGTLGEALAYYEKEPARGEFTIVVAGAPVETERWSNDRVQAALRVGLSEDEKPSQLARRVAAESGWVRSAVYDLLQDLRKETK
jgi:16S rRNA (cytidine1402-2'-O)-methyltransferase